MNSKELLEQATAKVEQINELMAKVDVLDAVLTEAQYGDIAIHSSNGTTFLIYLLGPEKMLDFKKGVVDALSGILNESSTQLEKLLGIRKPAIINPEFEKVVQEMEQHNKPDPVEEKLTVILQEEAKKIEGKPVMTEDEVKRLYIDEGKTMKEVADYFKVTKVCVNNYIYTHKLARKQIPKEDGFLDAKVQARQTKS